MPCPGGLPHPSARIRPLRRASGLRTLCFQPLFDYTYCSKMMPSHTPRRALSLLAALISLLYFLICPAVARAQTDQAVYTDALVNGWQNWSWATVNLSNTT